MRTLSAPSRRYAALEAKSIEVLKGNVLLFTLARYDELHEHGGTVEVSRGLHNTG